MARYEFLQLDDVMKVSFVGEQDEKIFIEASGAKLAALGVDPSAIVSTLSSTNSVDRAGTVENTAERVNVRVSGAFTSLDSIREMGIRAGNRTFRLGDIATVRRGYADPPTMKMRFQGKEAIGIAVSMRKGGDVIRLGDQLGATVAHVQASLPVGVQIHAVSDQPRVVKDSVFEFKKSLFEAVAIVLLVSFFSLGVRTGLVVALSIPLVLALTFLAMYVLGIELQRISLGALIIALGLLVDDAIIAVEMMVRKIEEMTAVNEARMEMALGNVDSQKVKIEEEAEKLRASELVKQFKIEMGVLPREAAAAPAEKTIGTREAQKV